MLERNTHDICYICDCYICDCFNNNSLCRSQEASKSEVGVAIFYSCTCTNPHPDPGVIHPVNSPLFCAYHTNSYIGGKCHNANYTNYYADPTTYNFSYSQTHFYWNPATYWSPISTNYYADPTT